MAARKPFTKGWLPRSGPGRRLPAMWYMSEGFLKLTRALEIAVINRDLTQREAGLLISEIDWALLMEHAADEANRQRRQHPANPSPHSAREPERQQKKAS